MIKYLPISNVLKNKYLINKLNCSLADVENGYIIFDYSQKEEECEDSNCMIDKYISEKINPYQIINGFISVIITEDVEIYDICNINILKELVEYTIKTFHTDIYAYVPITSPIFNDIINVYLTLEFDEPKIVLLKNVSNIRLKYIKSIIDKESVFDTITILKNKYVYENEFLVELSKEICNHKLYISENTCNKLKKYLNKDVEYGGLFIADKIVENMGTNEQYLNLIYATQTEKKGENYSVNAPISMFSFHTHPNICYEKHKCYVLWPSSPDMLALFTQYNNGLRKHFVITGEGIYSIQLTPAMMKLNKTLMKCMNTILENIKNIFIQLELYREEVYVETRNKIEVFDQYYKLCNELTLNDIFNDEKYDVESIHKCNINPYLQKEIKVFNILFAKWETIDNFGGFFDNFSYISSDGYQCDFNVLNEDEQSDNKNEEGKLI